MAESEATIPLTTFNSLLVSLGFSELPQSLLLRTEIWKKLDDIPADKVEVTPKQLLRLLTSSELSEFLDYSFNKHNNTYNIRVIRMALNLSQSSTTDSKVVTFEDIRMLRLSFSSYEAECSGIEKNVDLVLRVLRAAGKVIAKKQATDWLGEIRESVPNRLQLYEFINILPLCDTRNSDSLKVPEPDPQKLKKDKDGLFLLASSDFLQSPEMKLLGRLDESFEKAEEERKKKQAEESKRRAAEAAMKQGDRIATQKDTAAPVVEKLHRYDQLKEEMKETNSNRLAATRGASAVPQNQVKTNEGNAAQQRSTTPSHKPRGSQTSAINQQQMQQQNRAQQQRQDAATIDELSRNSQTKDIALQEQSFAPPTIFPQ